MALETLRGLESDHVVEKKRKRLDTVIDENMPFRCFKVFCTIPTPDIVKLCIIKTSSAFGANLRFSN